MSPDQLTKVSAHRRKLQLGKLGRVRLSDVFCASQNVSGEQQIKYFNCIDCKETYYMIQRCGGAKLPKWYTDATETPEWFILMSRYAVRILRPFGANSDSPPSFNTMLSRSTDGRKVPKCPARCRHDSPAGEESSRLLHPNADLLKMPNIARMSPSSLQRIPPPM